MRFKIQLNSVYELFLSFSFLFQMFWNNEWMNFSLWIRDDDEKHIKIFKFITANLLRRLKFDKLSPSFLLSDFFFHPVRLFGVTQMTTQKDKHQLREKIFIHIEWVEWVMKPLHHFVYKWNDIVEISYTRHHLKFIQRECESLKRTQLSSIIKINNNIQKKLI